jgi:hypothetical protein
VWLEISAVVFEWLGAPATLNFLTDVTLRRQVEQDIRSALARERELSELKSRFVAVASHEFRTPLAAILSSVELLDDYGDRLPPDERKEMLTLIKTAVSRMNDMVDQVLLTSKLESGKFVFSPRPQRMPELMVQIAAEMDRANPQAARIAMECDGVDDARQIDPHLVRHIMVNLLGNALKYSPPDSQVTCAGSGRRATAAPAGERPRHRHPGGRPAPAVRELSPRHQRGQHPGHGHRAAHRQGMREPALRDHRRGQPAGPWERRFMCTCMRRLFELARSAALFLARLRGRRCPTMYATGVLPKLRSAKACADTRQCASGSAEPRKG